MSKSDNLVRSLAQYFDAPDDYTGEFGWVIGYSADASFMRDAAERFTRKTLGQRGWEGRNRLALILDPGSPQLTPVDVPGVAHLGMRPGKRPFRLMHAKVALLLYCHETDRSLRMIRLIVSTGNWTRQTLEESLDLCWSVETNLNDLSRADDSLSAMADIRAAWDFVSYLRELYDVRILDQRGSDFTDILARFPKKLPAPRFLDNRRNSLLDQLPSCIGRQGSTTARRHLSMGAGFFEPSGDGAVPRVLEAIHRKLSEAGLLTQNPEVTIFVNPAACQAVANSAETIRARHWSIHRAGVPKFLASTPRTLHAKFLFSANFREGSNNCSSPWVYIGSGNLTEPGFMQKMSYAKGNLEAGVVFAPARLIWKAEPNCGEFNVVTNLLPVQWETEVQDFELAAGGKMPDRGVEFLAPPVAWLEWKAGRPSRLEIPDNEQAPFEVLDNDSPCVKDTGAFVWPHDQPRQVVVRWENGGSLRHALIPVRDEHGRFASGPLPPLNHLDAWLQLANFPMPPAEEEIDDESLTGEVPDGSSTTNAGANANASYPIRDMMALVENIAQKQTAITVNDWSLWLVRLEQTLFQMAECNLLKEFKELGINPLSPLRHAAFRPRFAETADSAEGGAYERVIARVEDKWSVGEMRHLEKA